MLRSVKDMQAYTIRATDGTIGHVKDLYFDDEAWVVRYLIVDTGGWLSNRKVLISPFAIGHPDWAQKILPVSITKEQVKNSPPIDTDRPVSRQHEMEYLGYYGYPNYWGGPGFWGAGAYPGMMLTGVGYSGAGSQYRQAQAEGARAAAEAQRHQNDDPHLRSCQEVIKYHIQASDGDIGHLQSLLIEEDTWAIRYLIVNTSNWWLGHEVLIAPQWIQSVSWPDKTISVNLTRQAVQASPPYDSAAQLDREHETGIYDHYGRPGYWMTEAKSERNRPDR